MIDTDIRAAKAALRAEMRTRRADLHAARVTEAARGLLTVFQGTFGNAPAGPVAGFIPIGTEIDTRPLLDALDDADVPLALPVVTGKGEPLVFRAWAAFEPLVAGSFGTRHPPADVPEVVPALVLVPGLAFDRQGYRLGYGGGFYDRTLAGWQAAGHTPLTVGIAFAGQEVPSVPRDASDQPLDWIVTDCEAISCSGRPARPAA